MRAKVTDNEVRAAADEGLTRKQMAERFSVSKTVISRRLIEMGIEVPNDSKGRPMITRDVFERAWNSGAKYEDIAQRLGISKSGVWNYAKRFGLKRNSLLDTLEPLAAPQRAVKPKMAEDGLIGQLIASGGKWRALNAIAAQHGMSTMQVQAAYHRARSHV